ncbi:hypothetical protein C8R47DRAFT_1220551 [Mycena vitilis]|nr:hypothetical protein C8R47DRAFT_1220551 [Mycena vitilis]
MSSAHTQSLPTVTTENTMSSTWFEEPQTGWRRRILAPVVFFFGPWLIKIRDAVHPPFRSTVSSPVGTTFCENLGPGLAKVKKFFKEASTVLLISRVRWMHFFFAFLVLLVVGTVLGTAIWLTSAGSPADSESPTTSADSPTFSNFTNDFDTGKASNNAAPGEVEW